MLGGGFGRFCLKTPRGIGHASSGAAVTTPASHRRPGVIPARLRLRVGLRSLRKAVRALGWAEIDERKVALNRAALLDAAAIFESLA